MRKIGILGVALLIMLMLFFNVCGNITKFKDGVDETIVSLDLPTLNAIANLSVPAVSIIGNATMNVSGMAIDENGSIYPENVDLKVNDSSIWGYQLLGFGPLGKQDRFSNERKQVNLTFGYYGGNNSAFVRLPKYANVKNASIQLAEIPQMISGELINYSGGAVNDSLGWSVSSAGDVNGDGYDDVIIGAPYNDSAGNNAGIAYLLYGGPVMDNIPDVVLTGVTHGDYFGATVSNAGDVNRDGYSDVIVGAYGNDANGTLSGAAYIFFGGPSMDNSSDLVLLGMTPGDMFGWSVSGAGDVNNDGYDDIVVGSAYNDTSGSESGAAYIYYGGANMDNTTDRILIGVSAGDHFGDSVSGAGDVNKDGYDDVVVGARYSAVGGTDAGRAYIFFGGINMDNVADVIMTGEAAYDEFGFPVSNAGDVNGDGYDDVIVGGGGNDADGNDCGRIYIYFGSQNMNNIPDVIIPGTAPGEVYCKGHYAGDVNNDGFDDVIAGACVNDSGGTNAGKSCVYLGGQAMDNQSDANFTGFAANDEFGWSVSGAGDVNEDGYDEVIIGAEYNDGGGNNAGRAYIYSLKNDTSDGILNPKITIGSNIIWNATGYFNGTASIIKFTDNLNSYLNSNKASGNDGNGNSYVDIPINIEAKSGGKISLFNLSVTYEYNATVPNFAGALNKYIQGHQKEKDANGNITVPINISAKTPGRLRLSNLKIDYIIDQPPSMVKDIGTTYVDEDTAVVTLVDLYQYFKDDLNPVNNLTFAVVSATNSSYVRLWITANRYLSADAMTGTANDNWTGTVQTKVNCTDKAGLKTESNIFTIVVKNVNDAPIITSSAPLKVENGVPYFYNVTSIDGDNDSIGYSLLKAPPNMTIDGTTGKIIWNRPVKGHYEVDVKADDGNNGSDVQIFFLTVGNVGPHITSAAPTIGQTWVKYVYNVTAEDTDNDRLNFSLETNVIGMEINGSTGVLTWTPQFAGQFSATVFVSDGEMKDRQEFTINVLQGNNAPKFVTKAVVSGTVGILYTYSAKALDDDGDGVVYSIIGEPSGMTMENKGGNGIVSWTPTTAGNFTFAILASDGKGGEGKQELTINVVPVTRPTLEILRPIEGAKVSGKVDVSGLAVKGTRDVVKVQVNVDGGEWVEAVGNASWTFIWDTTKAKNGNHIISARAFDGTDYSDIANRTLAVNNQKSSSKGFIPGFEGLMVVAVMSLVVATGPFRRKKWP